MPTSKASSTPSSTPSAGKPAESASALIDARIASLGDWRAPMLSRLRAMVTEYSGFHFVHEDPQQWPDPPTSRRLAEIRCPTLVIVGERDVPDFRAIAGALADGIPGAEKIVIPGAGHMANMEAPAAVNELLLAHLRASAATT